MKPARQLQVTPAAALEPACEPEEHGLDAELLGGHEQDRRPRAGKRRDREAGEDQAVEGRPSRSRGPARRRAGPRPSPRRRPRAARRRTRWRPSRSGRRPRRLGAAPALTPSSPASAIGFRKIDCRHAPTTARPPPTSAAISTLGSRTDQRIASPAERQRRGAQGRQAHVRRERAEHAAERQRHAADRDRDRDGDGKQKARGRRRRRRRRRASLTARAGTRSGCSRDASSHAGVGCVLAERHQQLGSA